MNYIAINVLTNEVFSFKGAYKLATFLGISVKTVYRNANSTISNKEYNGYKIVKPSKGYKKYSNRGKSL